MLFNYIYKFEHCLLLKKYNEVEGAIFIVPHICVYLYITDSTGKMHFLDMVTFWKSGYIL